jgi:tetratricopeptide (TPR) repeat protein
MKATTFLFLSLTLGLQAGRAQTNVAPVAPDSSSVAAPLTPAQIADYQKRFEAGYALQKQGQLLQARAIYEGILAEQPDAKRSLLEAGRISLELNDLAKADAYLEKLHALVPDFPDAYELLIQVNQGLKRDIKVERLVREFRALRDSGRVPGFSQSLFFERERVELSGDQSIVFTQFFDFTQPPYYALKAELFGPGHASERVLLLKYDVDGTQELHKKDPAASNGNVFILAEPISLNGKMTRIDVYQELFTTPDYTKARDLMLGIFVRTPKPVYSAPVDPAAAAPPQ